MLVLIYIPGKKAFSEPESKAISDFLKNNNEEEGKKRFYAFMTLHTYAQMWIHPYSHEYNTYPSDADTLKSVALRATERLEQIYGTHYRVGTGADLLAPASGGSDDWAKETLGIKYVYLVELRPKLELSNGFILNQEELLDTAIETFEAIKEVIKAVIDEPPYENLKNITETNIKLINDNLKQMEVEEERINSNSTVNEFKQYLESTFGTTIVETIDTTETQMETTITTLKQEEEKEKLEQYTQHNTETTTETFDFIFRIEEGKEGEKEIKKFKENKINNSTTFTEQEVLFPLFNNSKISEQKIEEFVTSSNLPISLPFTVNSQIENIEESTSSSNILTSSNTFQETLTPNSTIIEDIGRSETTSTSSTSSSSSTTSKRLITSTTTNIETLSISGITNTNSSSTSTSSSSTSKTTLSSPSSTTKTLPTLLTTKKYIPIEFVSFDEKKIELKPLNEIKKYFNNRSSTKSINFPIFDNDIEIDKEIENEEEIGKITTEKIKLIEKIEGKKK
ncbi:Peptidase_M14 domain-containing protein [Meloidogyne graminicola]|uniref:Peptidase_M14 domain-containing protein n=1 Tax=Meloidogyne graminicola TaxID=189291 RepID=A0A8T0A1A2_9BILA|nr:Peptidase_M14 domain-containing protein [Meloidogyne graminicola]KAF7639176.1 Peptidase_M14 domain-containing protein [Meloidogyne graminicola]